MGKSVLTMSMTAASEQHYLHLYLYFFLFFPPLTRCLQSHQKPFISPKRIRSHSLTHERAPCFIVSLTAQKQRHDERHSAAFPLRCLFKSLCLSHPSQLTLNHSNQIKKSPRTLALGWGSAPHPLLSRRDGYRLRAIKAFVGLLR